MICAAFVESLQQVVNDVWNEKPLFGHCRGKLQTGLFSHFWTVLFALILSSDVQEKVTELACAHRHQANCSVGLHWTQQHCLETKLSKSLRLFQCSATFRYSDFKGTLALNGITGCLLATAHAGILQQFDWTGTTVTSSAHLVILPAFNQKHLFHHLCPKGN